MKKKPEPMKMIEYNSMSDESLEENDKSTYKITQEQTVSGSKYYKIDDKIETFEHTNINERVHHSSSKLRYLSCSGGDGGDAKSYKDVVEKQMLRLRRICAKDEDFVWTVNKLRERCLNSDFDVRMIEEIMKSSLLQLDRYRAITIVV